MRLTTLVAATLSAVAGSLLATINVPQQASSGRTEAVTTRWIRPGEGNDKPLWGLPTGVQVALWPASVEGPGQGGPRGLFRIGVPMLDGGKRHGLINFVAVEPIVSGRRGFSELEKSDRDGEPGKLFWSGLSDEPPARPEPGRLAVSRDDEILRITVSMEKFANGARPIVDVEIARNRPEEVRFTVRSAERSAPMEYCVLTATMGNYARLRKLWLKDGIVEPKRLWPDFHGDEFTPEAFFQAAKLPVAANGDIIVCATTDEEAPWEAPADPRAPWWRYRGSFNLTQYWRKPKGTARPGLRLRVNGRRVYWANHTPIPGGLAYENFDLVEPFHEGQVFVYGVTRKSPQEVLAEGASAR